MNIFRRLMILREENNGDGNDLGAGVETQDPDALAILESLKGGDNHIGDDEDIFGEDNEENILPSDKKNEDNNTKNDKKDDDKLLAGKYKSAEELKKGIKGIVKDVPDIVIDSMTTEGLEAYYADSLKRFSTRDKRHQVDGDSEPKKENKYEVNEEEDNKGGEQGDDKPKAVPQELWTNLKDTFTELGGIKKSQYEELAKHGIPATVVDEYIDGIKAKQENFTRKVYELAGGEEQFKVIEEWANNNLSEAEIQYISGLSQDNMILALKGVKARYDLAHSETQRISGTNSSNNTGVYRDADDYVKDVQDERYTKDPAYRKKVEEKLKRSKIKL